MVFKGTKKTELTPAGFTKSVEFSRERQKFMDTETIDKDGLQLATGYFPYEQAVAMVPFNPFNDGPLSLKRLIARKSLPVVKLGAARRIRLEDVKVFLDGFVEGATPPTGQV